MEAVKILKRDRILEHVRELGAYALARLQGFARDYEIVAEARGSGLMLGMELVDPLTGEPNTEAALAVQRTALDRGLIFELGGRGGAVLRMLPPLNVTRETLDQAFEILDGVLCEVAAQPAVSDELAVPNVA